MYSRLAMFDGPPSGMFAKRGGPPFSLTTLRADANCVLIQDPSAVWGIQDFLPRRNLLLATDTLATQTCTTVATGYVLYCQGTGSITLSGTSTGTLNGTGASNRVSLAFTATAGTLTLTVSGAVTYGMLCRADTIDQSYQKITDWTAEQYARAAAKNAPWLRQNMHTYTEGAFNNGTYYSKQVSGSASTPVVTDNYADGPFPGSRASRVVFARTGTTASDYSALQSATVQVPTGIQEYSSLYIKSNTGSDQTLIFYGANDTGTTPRIITATTNWTRIKAGSNGGPATGRVWFLGTRGGSGQFYTGGDLNCDVQICCSQLALADVPYQQILTTWDAQYTANALAAGYPISLWQDSAGTNAVNADNEAVGKCANIKSPGTYDATQSTAANQPKWRLDGNGKGYFERDQVNDSLPVTLPNLGSDCEVYVGIGSTVSESVDQTISGSYAPITPAADYGRVVFTTTPRYRDKLIKWLKAKAGY